ncbi:MAG: tyrosine-protein phosphatase [Thermoleophilia bacterium]|nr:tyrosine-protein phosphatase [Thermoleophilia bacterium]
MLERALRWDGCVNVRDLGGLPTADGGETRVRRVVRADSVRGLSDAGWAALADYGVRSILDLRWHEELAEDPPTELPLDVVHVSLLGDFDAAYGRELDALAAAQPTAVEATREVYLAFLRRYAENFARAIAAIADAREGAVVVHCAAGKDRTGLVVALLLRLAGVRDGAIAADYALSEASWAPYVGRWIEDAETERERARRERLALCPPEAVIAVLAALEREHGAVDAYLRRAGATQDELDRAAARLLG